MFRSFLASLSPASAARTLAEATAGSRVRIVELATAPGAETLRERGLCENAEVRVLSTGDPLVCLVLGSRLMLNRTAAAGITVEPLS